MVQAYALKQILEPGYDVRICTDNTAGIQQAAEWQPSLILLDVIMPVLDGFEVLGRLKHQEETQDVPIILITGLTDVGNEEKGLTLGAVDYITKPFNPGIVRARVRTHISLYEYRRAAEELARVDGLTGIFNRRYADEHSGKVWLRAMQQRTPLSAGMLDIDYFKQYNDHYGHPAGDGVLRSVAQIINSTIRQPGSFAARCGGEEFLFLISDAPAHRGAKVAEEIRRAVEGLAVPHAGSSISPVLTVSMGGVTRIPQPGDTLSFFLEQVDRMLYQAKASGRNQVVWDDGGLSDEASQTETD